MAQVKINIPGIGIVDAENAASEDTLLKILAAMSRADTGGAGGAKRREAAEKKASDESIKSKKGESKSADDAADNLGKLGKTAKDQKTEQDRANKEIRTYSDTLTSGYAQVSSAVKDTVTGFTSAAITLTTQMATSYNQMARDPIGAAAGLLNTAIDGAALAARKTTDVVAGVGKAATAWIPFVGSSAVAAVDAADKIAKAAIEATVLLAKTTNDIFAAEFKKTADSMRSFSRQGASFAGGMDEMRQLAHSSGLSLAVFSSAVAASSDNIREAGLSQGEGARQLAGIMGKVSTTVGVSGRTLRTEMDALGFNYEEQTKIAAQLMAMDKTSGRQRAQSDEEIAKRTKDYAADLKVLADITGQNAQKAMEDARIKSMEGDILAQMKTPEEMEKFRAALASTPESMKKGFLEFVSSGGQVVTDVATNVAQAQGLNIMGTFQTMYDGIKNSVVPPAGFQDEVLSGFRALGQDAKNIGPEIFQAIRLGGLTGAIADSAKIINEAIRIGMMSPDEVRKSREAAEAQSSVITGTTDAFTKLNSQANDFAVLMETKVSENLDKYGTLLADTYTKTAEAFGKGLEWIEQGMKLVEGQSATTATNVPAGETAGGARTTPITPYERRMAAQAARARLSSASLVGGDMSLASPHDMGDVTPTEMAVGGIVKSKRGGVPLIAAEAGMNEAFVPLPDGKTIPVNMSAELKQSILDSNNVVAELFKELRNTMQSMMSNSGDVDTSNQDQMIMLMTQFVEAQREAKREMEDQTQALRRLYDAYA